MSFHVSTRPAAAGAASGTVYTLDGPAARAEVWPFAGFNCLRWQVRNADGSWGDILYTAPDWEQNPVPTRSGHPVLFPFPNRFADGRFTFEGTDYQLPKNESTGRHAIHGFTPRNAWRVVATEAAHREASITGEFRPSTDLPAALELWPTDFVLRLTYRLTATTLAVEAVVENPTPKPLPFGLGYHPYFCVPTAPGAAADDMVVYSAAGTLWEADDGIPNGRRLPVPADLDFRTPRPVGGLVLDRLFTDVFAGDGPQPVAWLAHRTAPGRLVVECPPAFRELLLFTPPHRRAVAIEPYTCASDAANLAARGVDSGWRVLPAGGRFAADATYRWEPGFRP